MASQEEKQVYLKMARILGGGATPERCQKTMQAFSQALAETLLLHGEVRIENLGLYTLRDAGRTGGIIEYTDFQTGERVEKYVEKQVMVTWKSAQRIKDIINQREVNDTGKGKASNGRKKKRVRKSKSKSPEEIKALRMRNLEEMANGE